MDRPFLCYFALNTPALLGRRLTLDGLLAGALFSRLQDLDRALAEIPLKQTNGVFHGSAAFLEGQTAVGSFTVGSSLQINRLDPETVAPNKNGKYPTVSLANGEFRNRQTHYVSSTAKAVWFAGLGDPDRTRMLLGEIDGLGAKRTSGWGEVLSFEVAEVDTLDPHYGLKLTDGTPARPVPIDLWDAIGGGDAPRGYERFAPPYIHGDAVLCALPAPRAGALEKPQLFDLFGDA